MSTPINWYKQDRDYYSPKDSNYKDHIKSIVRNLKLDKLINLASLDGSYSILVKKDKDV